MPRALVVAAAAGASVVVGVALAANSASFGDPASDSRWAPDLTAVAVSSDDSGTVTVRVTVGNRTALDSDDEMIVGIDVDQNPDTGSVLYGAEFGVELEDRALRFFRPGPSGEFDEAAKPASLQGSFSGGVATFSFAAGEVGIGPRSGFNLFATGYALGLVDAAPDIRTFNYQLVAGTPRLLPGRDNRRPLDTAVKSEGTHGKVARLKFLAADGRGETADTIRVYRGRRLLKTLRYSLNDTSPFFTYFGSWRIPRSVRGTLRFCVRSVDRAGNRSNVSCAPLIVR